MLVILVLQSKGQIPGDSPPDPSHFMRNGSSPGSNFTEKLDHNHNIVTSAAASGAQDQAETDHMASGWFTYILIYFALFSEVLSETRCSTGYL